MARKKAGDNELAKVAGLSEEGKIASRFICHGCSSRRSGNFS